MILIIKEVLINLCVKAVEDICRNKKQFNTILMNLDNH